LDTKQRRHFTNQEKVMIIKQNLVEKTPVSELCDKYKICPSVYYRWQKEFFENADKAFVKGANEDSALQKKVKKLEEKLIRKNEVLSELMEEHIALKKNLGES
jgi:transposase-like protein